MFIPKISRNCLTEKRRIVILNPISFFRKLLIYCIEIRVNRIVMIELINEMMKLSVKNIENTSLLLAPSHYILPLSYLIINFFPKLSTCFYFLYVI